MRVRRSELRLLAAILAGLWVATVVLLLGWYRPGGPFDLLVGVTAALPALVAATVVAWPPTAPDGRAGPAVTALGVLAMLVLVPALAALAGPLAGDGPRPILPSLEAAYSWLVALAATCTLAGLALAGRAAGLAVAGRALGSDRPRRPRVLPAAALAAGLTIASAGLIGGVVLANDQAIRDGAPVGATSRFGPADPDLGPPACDGTVAVGPTAILEARLEADADGRPLGTVAVAGARDGDDLAWTAEVATAIATGPAGATAIGPDSWLREPGAGWSAMPATGLVGARLDATVLAAALEPARRIAAEDRGIVSVDGARARQCRLAIDGATFRAAFPQVRWLAGEVSLDTWRGELDYFVFGDGQLGRVTALVNGRAEPLVPGSIQATVRAELTATDRGQPVVLGRPE